MQEAGLRSSDFEASLTLVDPPAAPGDVALIITVTMLLTGKSRTYLAIEVVGWVCDFKQDLADGAFGPVQPRH